MMRTTLLALLCSLAGIEAWVSPIVLGTKVTRPGGLSATALLATRRDMIVLAGFVGIVGVGAIPLGAAYAELDYSKVQDLLGADALATYEVSPGKRPTYLTEPTSDFLENEQKAIAFQQANLKRKATFLNSMEILSTAPNDESQLIAALDDMRRQVKTEGGLPIGITKEMVVKTCRRRKSLKYWPTNVEIAYQDLLLEISYQQSPNTDRDTNML